MTTTDNSRADALTDEHFNAAQKVFHSILVLEMSELSDRNSPEDEPDAMIANDREMAGCIDRTLERTGLVVVPRGLLAASPVEQHEAAPADALTDLVESYGRALLAQRTDEAAAILDCIRRGDAVQTVPAMGSMTLAERIAHVGGRITDGGYVEFGSAMAIDALIKHVLRDVRVAAQAAPLEGTGNGADGRALYERLHTLMPEWYPDAWDDLLPKYRDAYATAALSRAPRTEMAEAAHCQCPACCGGVIHASDCAVHNAPALPRAPCDCGVGLPDSEGGEV